MYVVFLVYWKLAIFREVLVRLTADGCTAAACDALQGIMGGQPLAHLDMEDLVGKKTRKRSLLPTPLRFCLVVLTCFNHLENMSSSVGMMTFPIYGKIKCSKPRTSHLYLYTTVLVGFGINCIHLYTCLEPATVYYEALLFCWHQNSPGFQEAYGKIISFNTSTVSMIVGHNGYSGMYIMHQGFYLILWDLLVIVRNNYGKSDRLNYTYVRISLQFPSISHYNPLQQEGCLAEFCITINKPIETFSANLCKGTPQENWSSWVISPAEPALKAVRT